MPVPSRPPSLYEGGTLGTPTHTLVWSTPSLRPLPVPPLEPSDDLNVLIYSVAFFVVGNAGETHFALRALWEGREEGEVARQRHTAWRGERHPPPLWTMITSPTLGSAVREEPKNLLYHGYISVFNESKCGTRVGGCQPQVCLSSSFCPSPPLPFIFTRAPSYLFFIPYHPSLPFISRLPMCPQ